MPRPAQEQLYGEAHDTPGYGPDQASNFTTSVVAPLDVKAAPQQATLLAKALGHAVDIATPALEQQARQQGSADEAAGEAAGALGVTSPDQSSDADAMTKGFMVGLKKIQTQQTAFQAANAARAFAAQNQNMPTMDSTDANGNPVKGLVSNIDDIYRQYFPAGQEKDPEAAKAMAPILQHTFQEILGERNMQEIKGAQQSAEDTITGQLVHDAQENTSLFNRDEALQTLQQVYGPDKRGALSALVHSVGEGAVQGADPSIIDKILPASTDFGGGVRMTPQDLAYLDQAKSRALETQQKANHANVVSAQDTITGGMLSGKDPMAALQNYVKMPGADADWAMHAASWYYQRGKERQADAVDNNSNTWDMDRATSDGTITNSGQLLSWLTDRGVGNTKAGNMMFQRGMSNIRSFQNTTTDDPDYRASYADISQLYKPATNPMTGKFLNEAANSQQAGALLDYRTEYNAQVKQGKSSTDAARQASQNVRAKWGDPVESSNGTLSNRRQPQSDADQATVVSNAAKNPQAFHGSGIKSSDITRLMDLGMVSRDDATAALRLIVARTQH